MTDDQRVQFRDVVLNDNLASYPRAKLAAEGEREKVKSSVQQHMQEGLTLMYNAILGRTEIAGKANSVQKANLGLTQQVLKYYVPVIDDPFHRKMKDQFNQSGKRQILSGDNLFTLITQPYKVVENNRPFNELTERVSNIIALRGPPFQTYGISGVLANYIENQPDHLGNILNSNSSQNIRELVFAAYTEDRGMFKNVNYWDKSKNDEDMMRFKNSFPAGRRKSAIHDSNMTVYNMTVKAWVNSGNEDIPTRLFNRSNALFDEGNKFQYFIPQIAAIGYHYKNRSDDTQAPVDAATLKEYWNTEIITKHFRGDEVKQIKQKDVFSVAKDPERQSLQKLLTEAHAKQVEENPGLNEKYLAAKPFFESKPLPADLEIETETFKDIMNSKRDDIPINFEHMAEYVSFPPEYSKVFQDQPEFASGKMIDNLFSQNTHLDIQEDQHDFMFMRDRQTHIEIYKAVDASHYQAENFFNSVDRQDSIIERQMNPSFRHEESNEEIKEGGYPQRTETDVSAVVSQPSRTVTEVSSDEIPVKQVDVARPQLPQEYVKVSIPKVQVGDPNFQERETAIYNPEHINFLTQLMSQHSDRFQLVDNRFAILDTELQLKFQEVEKSIGQLSEQIKAENTAKIQEVSDRFQQQHQTLEKNTIDYVKAHDDRLRTEINAVLTERQRGVDEFMQKQDTRIQEKSIDEDAYRIQVNGFVTQTRNDITQLKNQYTSLMGEAREKTGNKDMSADVLNKLDAFQQQINDQSTRIDETLRAKGLELTKANASLSIRQQETEKNVAELAKKTEEVSQRQATQSSQRSQDEGRPNRRSRERGDQPSMRRSTISPMRRRAAGGGGPGGPGGDDDDSDDDQRRPPPNNPRFPEDDRSQRPRRRREEEEEKKKEGEEEGKMIDDLAMDAIDQIQQLHPQLMNIQPNQAQKILFAYEANKAKIETMQTLALAKKQKIEEDLDLQTAQRYTAISNQEAINNKKIELAEKRLKDKEDYQNKLHQQKLTQLQNENKTRLDAIAARGTQQQQDLVNKQAAKDAELAHKRALLDAEHTFRTASMEADFQHKAQMARIRQEEKRYGAEIQVRHQLYNAEISAFKTQAQLTEARSQNLEKNNRQLVGLVHTLGQGLFDNVPETVLIESNKFIKDAIVIAQDNQATGAALNKSLKSLLDEVGTLKQKTAIVEKEKLDFETKRSTAKQALDELRASHRDAEVIKVGLFVASLTEDNPRASKDYSGDKTIDKLEKILRDHKQTVYDKEKVEEEKKKLEKDKRELQAKYKDIVEVPKAEERRFELENQIEALEYKKRKLENDATVLENDFQMKAENLRLKNSNLSLQIEAERHRKKLGEQLLQEVIEYGEDGLPRKIKDGLNQDRIDRLVRAIQISKDDQTQKIEELEGKHLKFKSQIRQLQSELNEQNKLLADYSTADLVRYVENFATKIGTITDSSSEILQRVKRNIQNVPEESREHFLMLEFASAAQDAKYKEQKKFYSQLIKDHNLNPNDNEIQQNIRTTAKNLLAMKAAKVIHDSYMDEIIRPDRIQRFQEYELSEVYDPGDADQPPHYKSSKELLSRFKNDINVEIAGHPRRYQGREIVPADVIRTLDSKADEVIRLFKEADTNYRNFISFTAKKGIISGSGSLAKQYYQGYHINRRLGQQMLINTAIDPKMGYMIQNDEYSQKLYGKMLKQYEKIESHPIDELPFNMITMLDRMTEEFEKSQKSLDPDTVSRKIGQSIINAKSATNQFLGILTEEEKTHLHKLANVKQVFQEGNFSTGEVDQQMSEYLNHRLSMKQNFELENLTYTSRNVPLVSHMRSEQFAQDRFGYPFRMDQIVDNQEQQKTEAIRGDIKRQILNNMTQASKIGSMAHRTSMEIVDKQMVNLDPKTAVQVKDTFAKYADIIDTQTVARKKYDHLISKMDTPGTFLLENIRDGTNPNFSQETSDILKQVFSHPTYATERVQTAHLEEIQDERINDMSRRLFNSGDFQSLDRISQDKVEQYGALLSSLFTPLNSLTAELASFEAGAEDGRGEGDTIAARQESLRDQIRQYKAQIESARTDFAQSALEPGIIRFATKNDKELKDMGDQLYQMHKKNAELVGLVGDPDTNEHINLLIASHKTSRGYLSDAIQITRTSLTYDELKNNTVETFKDVSLACELVRRSHINLNTIARSAEANGDTVTAEYIDANIAGDLLAYTHGINIQDKIKSTQVHNYIEQSLQMQQQTAAAKDADAIRQISESEKKLFAQVSKSFGRHTELGLGSAPTSKTDFRDAFRSIWGINAAGNFVGTQRQSDQAIKKFWRQRDVVQLPLITSLREYSANRSQFIRSVSENNRVHGVNAISAGTLLDGLQKFQSDFNLAVNRQIANKFQKSSETFTNNLDSRARQILEGTGLHPRRHPVSSRMANYISKSDRQQYRQGLAGYYKFQQAYLEHTASTRKHTQAARSLGKKEDIKAKPRRPHRKKKRDEYPTK